jgi:hypothetical protein
VPSALHADNGLQGDRGLPDLWSGIWPANLLNADGTETPLGTLTWKPIRYAEGVALIGKDFGGRAFEGCPEDGRTRFFRGFYVEGGDLIGCTRGESADVLVGRFNGRLELRSGSFEVTMLEPDEFLGKYFEDGGITTDWWGALQERLSLGNVPVDADYTAPELTMRLPKLVSAGATLKLRLAAKDAGASVRADITVRSGAKRLARVQRVALAPTGAPRIVSLKLPRSARGTLGVCVAATDGAGNESSRCARVGVR